MSVKSIFASALLFLGIILILIALISAYFFLISFIERQSYGSGLLFADVEIFGLVTIIFTIMGAAIIFISRKILRLKSNDKKVSS